MAEKRRITDFDRLILVSYLTLQDRIFEAKTLFEKIDAAPFESTASSILKLQFNYMRAYFDFYDREKTGCSLAKAISEHYSNYPVITWRMKFLEIRDQLKEVDGEASDDEEMEEASKKKEEKKEPSKKKMMSFELDGSDIVVTYDNVPSVKVKYYLIDPEVAFSRVPFLTGSAEANEAYSFVKETKMTEVALDPNLKSMRVPIDPEFTTSNVMIEVNAIFHHEFKTYFAHKFKVTMYESYGELKVTDTDGKPLPAIYVKVYSKSTGGECNLYKDGYTDIRGKFEYESSNLDNISRFSILILSEDKGSTRIECKPSKTVITSIGNDTQKVREQDFGYMKQRQFDKYFSKPIKSKKAKGKKKY